jgi:hypothetical protein
VHGSRNSKALCPSRRRCEEERALEQASEGGFLGDSRLAGLENASRSRILANPDPQNLGDSIRYGTPKVCHLFCVARESPDV